MWNFPDIATDLKRYLTVLRAKRLQIQRGNVAEMKLILQIETMNAFLRKC